MKGTKGQSYTNSLFFSGLGADIDAEMLDGKLGTVIESHAMHVSNKHKNVLRKLLGEKIFVPLAVLGDQIFTGAIWLNGYVCEFWRDITSGKTNIYANGLLIAQHEDLPGRADKFIDIDSNSETWELYITDNFMCPIVLNLKDMLDSAATQIYFTDYDKALYEINRPIDLSQPVFQCLENLGGAGGLKAGSYSYAMRFSTVGTEKTAWGPSTPYIPIPYVTKVYTASDAQKANSGVLIGGQEASLTPTKYGVRLRLHINNALGFDHVELRRYANKTSQPISYTPTAEYLILSLDAAGAKIDIKNNQNLIVDFIDSDSLAWAILDESVLNTYSTIKRARTIRYYEKRIVLGGVEYESHLLADKDIFIQHNGVSKIAFPFLERLSYDGYSNMLNQVYKKSHRLGEKYGYAAKLYDNQGNMLYAVPLEKAAESLINYQFPDRRDIIPAAEQAYSPYAQTISTVNSWNPFNIVITDVVYEPIESLLIKKTAESVSTVVRRNIVNKTVSGTKYDYHPLTPTGRDYGYGGSGEDFSALGVDYESIASGAGSYNTYRHGTRKSAVGLNIAGLDPTRLPSWVKSFSIVRTPAAGRVVCQGIAMYALDPQLYPYNPSLKKALAKVWFYSPEFDLNLGDKSYLFDDIKANPSSYKMQLVSPVGFFTDMYSAYHYRNGNTSKVDMISYAIMGGNNVHSMEPVGLDVAADIGAGEDRVTFGHFRNSSYHEYLQGSGIDNTLTFVISSAAEPVLNGVKDVNNRSRTPYLELSLGSNIYAYTDVKYEAGTTPQSRKFHEPWYVVNIIKEGAEIANNNINSYNDIGHYIKLESLIGIGNGQSDQVYELTDEREEDVYTLAASANDYRYIWVDGKPWLGVNYIAGGTIDTYRTALDSGDTFTPSGGLACYGLYLYTYTLTSTGPSKKISFPYLTPNGKAIVPLSGEIKVKYNNNSSIKLFLGDTVVDDAIFAPIDCNLDFTDGNQTQTLTGVRIAAPMPYVNFVMSADHYYQPRDPELGTIASDVFEPVDNQAVDYIRQWLVSFGCESSVNLPFLYKDYFPNRNYVFRPAIYTAKLDTESIDDYYARLNIYPEYDIDYPDEYLNWGYGGFHIPSGNNVDYEKRLHTKGFTEPASGSNEILTLMKRLHWSTEGLIGFPSSKAFIPSNVYDLKNDKASQISILYDVFSDKGGNLYVVTDRGAGLLLTGKNVLTDGVGNSLGMVANDSTFIQGEVWLNQSLGCPREFWRGKSEGNVKLPNNVKVPILVFPTYNDIVMLSANTFVELADNNREKLVDSLVTIDLDRDFMTKLYSVVDEGENNIWVVIGDKTYLFNIDINNWCAHVTGLEYVKSLYAPYLGELIQELGNQSVNDRNVLAHIIGGENILPLPTTTLPTTTLPTTTLPTTTLPTTTLPTTTLPTTTSGAPPNLESFGVYTPGTGFPGADFLGWFYVNNIGGPGEVTVYWRILDNGMNIIDSAAAPVHFDAGYNDASFTSGEIFYPATGTGYSFYLSLDNWATSEYCPGTFDSLTALTTPAP
jgi:hypothetical protein